MPIKKKKDLTRARRSIDVPAWSSAGESLLRESRLKAKKTRSAIRIALPAPEHKPGEKHDQAKPRWDLVPYEVLAPMVLVLTKGAEKYTEDGWRKVKGWRRRYFAALMRHLVAWYLGEENDPEWGYPHLAHALCCLCFLLGMEIQTNEKKGKPAKRSRQ